MSFLEMRPVLRMSVSIRYRALSRPGVAACPAVAFSRGFCAAKDLKKCNTYCKHFLEFLQSCYEADNAELFAHLSFVYLLIMSCSLQFSHIGTHKLQNGTVGMN